MTADNHQKTYIGCHNIISNDESEGGLRELWGKGNITKETIIGMETAVLHQKVCTMGSSNYLKMWSMSGKDRTILF